MDVCNIDSVFPLPQMPAMRMGRQGVLQLSSPHTVTYTNNWPWHLISLQIDQMQQVSCVVVPTRLVTQTFFVQNAALALLRNVGNPYTSDPEIARLSTSEDFIP